MEFLKSKTLFLFIVACASFTLSAVADEGQGWKPHSIRQLDGKGGWIVKSAQYQILGRELGYGQGRGSLQMDNGEIVLLGTWNPTEGTYGDPPGEQTFIAFSKDRGQTWTDLERFVPHSHDRPDGVVYLDKGNLLWLSTPRSYLSSDYGRTWQQKTTVRTRDPKSAGGSVNGEGNIVMVDRDKNGRATRLAGLGPDFIAWSLDRAASWQETFLPDRNWQETVDGTTYTHGVSEPALVRAKNGWLVAAYRLDMARVYSSQPSNDSVEGLGVSISKDDGKTWSPIQTVYQAGRHHANLIVMPTGEIVMSHTIRVDTEDGKLLSYRRGCGAIVSHDNGLTWDKGHSYILDEYQFRNPKQWYDGACGHCSSILLDDGSILTVHNNYLVRGISLIRWRP